MPAVGAALRRVLASLACLSFVGASCAPGALTLLPGVVNDAHNLSLRRSLLAYGLEHVCDEVRARSMPLRFWDDDPIAGRFFPSTCSSRDLPNGDVLLQFAGQGYVWTEMSLRLGFVASAAVAYDTDFILDGETIYVYFRPRAPPPPSFSTRLVEQQQAALYSVLMGHQNGQSLPDSIGTQIMTAQLARGFTVIRDAAGSVAYGVGVVPPGVHPPEGYQGLDHAKPILANERVDVHQNQRDFAGPFAVPPGRALGVRVSVVGVPAVDVLLVPRAVGEAWLGAYTTQIATTPPPAAPLVDDVVATGASYQRVLTVPPGDYYLVLDNTSTAGRTSLPAAPRDDHAATVSLAVDLE